MPVQSIDLSGVTDATFNGSAVEQINLNGSGIWTKPLAGYSLRAFGAYDGNSIPVTHGNNITSTFDYLTKDNHLMVAGETIYGAGLIKTVTLTDGAISYRGIQHREQGNNQKAFGIYDDDNILQVYISTYDIRSSMGWAIDLSPSSLGNLNSGVTMLGYSELSGIAHKALWNVVSSGLPPNHVTFPILGAIDLAPHKNYFTPGIGLGIPSHPNLKTCFHIGSYDANGTFTVDDVFDTEKIIRAPVEYPGQYGPILRNKAIKVVKTASNELRIYEGPTDGSLTFSSENVLFSGPINGNHPNTSDIHSTCLNNICGIYSSHNFYVAGVGSSTPDHRNTTTTWSNGVCRVVNPSNTSQIIKILEFV